MHITSDTSYTKTLNPDAESWKDEVHGGYVPQVNMWGMSEADTIELAGIYEGLARKAKTLQGMKDYAEKACRILDALDEARQQAFDNDVKAAKDLAVWRANHPLEAVQDGLEGTEAVDAE